MSFYHCLSYPGSIFMLLVSLVSNWCTTKNSTSKATSRKLLIGWLPLLVQVVGKTSWVVLNDFSPSLLWFWKSLRVKLFRMGRRLSAFTKILTQQVYKAGNNCLQDRCTCNRPIRSLPSWWSEKKTSSKECVRILDRSLKRLLQALLLITICDWPIPSGPSMDSKLATVGFIWNVLQSVFKTTTTATTSSSSSSTTTTTFKLLDRDASGENKAKNKWRNWTTSILNRYLLSSYSVSKHVFFWFCDDSTWL